MKNRKKEIKLPKELHSWLAVLKKGLKKLNEEDRDDILLSYVEQFNEELTEGKSVVDIKNELRPIPEIVSEIYAEFNVDSVIKIKDKKKQKIVKVKISRDDEPKKMKTSNKVISVFSFLLSFWVWLLTIIVGMFAILLPVVVIGAITLSYINYDLYFATGLAVIFFGILPFVDTFLFFSTKGLYRTSIKMVKPFKQNSKKFGIKFWVILLMITGVISALILGVGVGTTYKNGFLDSSIHNKYQYQQELGSFTTYQDLADKIQQPNKDVAVTKSMVRDYFTSDLVGKFEINGDHYYNQKTKGKTDNKQELNLKIIRDYNLKKSYQLDDSLMKIQAVLSSDQVKIVKLILVLPELEWYNYAISWQPETLEFIYN